MTGKFATVSTACLLSFGLAMPAFAQGGPAAGPSGSPTAPTASHTTQLERPHAARDFLNNMAQMNQGEIGMGVLAEKQAEAPAVKAFARLMVADHMALESELSVAAGKLHIPLSHGIGETNMTMLKRLEPISGPKFGREYMHGMITGHEAALREIDGALHGAHDPWVRQVAMGARPIIEQHLALAKAVDQSISSPTVAQR